MNDVINISERELIDEFTETICQIYADAGNAVRNNRCDLAVILREQLDEMEVTKQKLTDDPNLLHVMSIMFGVIFNRRNNRLQGLSK